MKLNKDLCELIAELEYIVGSECYNPNSYDGWNDVEGCSFRYPINVPNSEGKYEKTRSNINIIYKVTVKSTTVLLSTLRMCDCSPLYSNGYNRLQSHILRGGIMAKGLQIIKENKNLAEWSRQVEECRNSGLSVRSWCEQHQIAVSTFHYRQQKVWKALQKSSQFVEVPLSFDESRDNIIAANKIAASVRIGGICAEVHNGANKATLTAIFRALKSCCAISVDRRSTLPAATPIFAVE